MLKKILVISGSPKKYGNTSLLISFFTKGAKSNGAAVEVVNAASLKNKASGCTSCRLCQDQKEYGCVIDDDASLVIKKMIKADAIVFATPLYFYGASAQLKVIIDRMFSLYHWDNETDEMKTCLAGKSFALIGSAFEDIGLKELEAPFKLTASYTGIPFNSLLVANAGESGDLKADKAALKRAEALGKKVSSIK
jgi:multimeric flavodoxin WrbA